MEAMSSSSTLDALVAQQNAVLMCQCGWLDVSTPAEPPPSPLTAHDADGGGPVECALQHVLYPHSASPRSTGCVSAR